MSIHLCKHPGCTVPVAKGHFLCIDHWRRLPGRIQQGVMTRANGWKAPAVAVEFLRSYQRQAGILRGGVL